MSMTFFLVSAGLFVVGALLALLTGRSEKLSRTLSSIFGAAASLFALIAGGNAIIFCSESLTLATPFAFAPLPLLINPLTGLLLVVINLLALAAWTFGFSYLREYSGREVSVIGFFMSLFIVAMNLLVAVDNVFWFLVFFEIMSLCSYFLVVVKQDEMSVKAGFLYLVMAHIGFLLIMIAFFIMSSAAGSFDFAVFRITDFGPQTASVVFLLTFIGFGIKAGMVPFHTWLPKAHPAAPSQVSALMSGAMIKIGIFGIVKVGLDLLASSGCELWWGLLIVLFGAVSAVFGIIYALTERDIKSLLAYSSIENIGIILLGVGTGFVGVALHLPSLAGLGFLAGLFHLLNHAVFKGLLFMGAGSVIFSTHTRDIEKLGGLIKVMPLTAVCFLCGSLAVAALPPLNGFVSEWFTYQAMFTAAFEGALMVRVVFALAAVALVVTGALALATFVKAFGLSFLGAPRTREAHEAREVPFTMKLAKVVLAAFCVGLGLGAPLVVPYIQSISASFLAGSPDLLQIGRYLFNPELYAVISPPMIALLLISLGAIVASVALLLHRGNVASNRDPWACGYLHETEMPMRPSSFAGQMNTFFKPLFTLRSTITAQSDKFISLFNSSVRGAKKAEDFSDRYVVDSVSSFVKWLALKSKGIEGGNFRVYLLYIVVALLVLLILAITFKGGGPL
ncbi:MAG: hydrogenase 4 subunit B [Coriobacteriales bacterium]|jgi:hydrogenase-4 component B|nr:hydrogenase 4 subunit B [Coriobacteriales bacterium]